MTMSRHALLVWSSREFVRKGPYLFAGDLPRYTPMA